MDHIQTRDIIYRYNAYYIHVCKNGGVLCCDRAYNIIITICFFSYCKNRHTGSNNTRRIQLTSFKLVGRSAAGHERELFIGRICGISFWCGRFLYSPAVSLLRVFLFYFIIIMGFFSFSSRTDTHTLIPSLSLYIYKFIFFVYTFYPRPQNWNTYYIICVRTLYTILFCLRQMDRSFGSQHHHYDHGIHTPF